MSEALVIQTQVKPEDAVKLLNNRSFIKGMIRKITKKQESFNYLETIYIPFYFVVGRAKIKKLLAGWFEYKELCGFDGLRGGCAVIGERMPTLEKQELPGDKLLAAEFDMPEIRKRTLNLFRHFVEKREKPLDAETYCIDKMELCYLPLHLIIENNTRKIYAVDASCGNADDASEIPGVRDVALNFV